MLRGFGRVLCIFLLAGLGLSACGIKPNELSAPQETEQDTFPQTYPDPATDPAPKRKY